MHFCTLFVSKKIPKKLTFYYENSDTKKILSITKNFNFGKLFLTIKHIKHCLPAR